MAFKHLGIIGKKSAPQTASIVGTAIDWCARHHLDFSLDKHTMPADWQNHPKAQPLSAWAGQADWCLVIGGDGTFLSAGRALADYDCPLVGVNAGRLGFLADVDGEQLESALSAIVRGEFVAEERCFLRVKIERNQSLIASFQALNDAVIHKTQMARMIELDVYNNKHFLSHYRADGLIVSTPTGSTAYALSAGGSLIEPNLPVMQIVPICPQFLTHRPIVLCDKNTLTICISKNNDANVQITIDGQEEWRLQAEDRIEITRGNTLRIIHPADYAFPQRLRTKLNWGSESL